MESTISKKYVTMFLQFALGKTAVLAHFNVFEKDLSIVHCQGPLVSEELK